MANHAGDIVVVYVTKALWQEFCERHWQEFEEFEELRNQHGLHLHGKTSMVVDSSPSVRPSRTVTIGNPAATIMNDSVHSDSINYL
uniref:ULP_PROTEASE domain-containing protein n=1 Tax=Angiostrongylus cantonensis TaxID=6313 RepID=A0A0K0CVB7_ANGCA